MLGNRALAQSGSGNSWTTTIEVKETIDFTGWNWANNGSPNVTVTPASNYFQKISGTSNNGDLEREYTDRVYVDNLTRWQLWRSDTHQETYFQKHDQSSNGYLNIKGLNKGDVVTIWGDNGNSGNNAGCRVTSGNTNRGDITFSTSNHQEGQEIKMQSDGILRLEFFARWSGVRKIEIKKNVNQTNIFDYDPGYEEYDMYDEFSWAKNNDPATTYSLTGSAGFLLNGIDAQYATFSGSKITANNRIALNVAPNYENDGENGNGTINDEWRFDFGLVPPGKNNDYSYFSICNLREGDRVVISYVNESENPLIFASGKKDGEYYYDGCAAFKDDNRNGVLNEGEEYIKNGDVASVEWHRGEGNIGSNDQGRNSGYAPELYYINSYVIAQDGHLDLAFKRFVENYAQGSNTGKKVSRIVKIKIYSDHQAMMVDDYDNGIYTAHFDITGHLQAKEHIMPGGLEIHVGNDDNEHIDQHAIVVYSKDGPVSYVNAVDGFKIPGVSKSGNQVSINFDLGVTGSGNKANLPTSGTYYKFIPETSGKMRFMFEAKSMNYYRWDLPGHGTYYNTDLKDANGNFGDWNAVNDRPNEQTVDAACPYYLVRIYNEDGQEKMQVISLGNINNGEPYEHSNEISVTAGEEYYLFGGWNQTGLYYNKSFLTPGDPYHATITNWDGSTSINPSYVDDTNHQYNNIEFRPMDGRTIGCGVAELLWVKFKRNDEIYPLAKWVPNNTTKVNDDADGGVPNPDTYQMEYELANIVGFTDYDDRIMVKKMSGNITGCEPYIVRYDPNDQTKGKLMIKNITFDGNGTKNPGGTILIKIGDPTKRTDPLYALTIAYSTDPKYDNENNIDHRGHIWDFHTESLKALTWDGTTANGAVPTPYGTYFQNYYYAGNQSTIENASTPDEVQRTLPKNENSILYDEVTNHGDWLFNYNLMYDQNLYDPIFTNKYDMEGDNADMIWDTEGTVFQTSANQSGIFNEYTTNGGTVQNTETTDPNRYVAILKGGKFRIPWLQKNDRVIIWMGSGTGRTNDFVSFKIKNAFDAVHNPISEDDEYIVGGSQWTADGEKYNYHGCYHFFATGRPNDSSKPADMIFEMTGGEMCKIYKIQIYRGDRIITNEIVGTNDENNKFLLWNTEPDPNDAATNAETVQSGTYKWTLKHLGKEQQLANGTGKNTQKNEIIAQTGWYKLGTPVLINNNKVAEGGTSTTSEVESFTYEHDNKEFGTFRMRGKDMEKNMNYVADYADHNVTIAYQQTQLYPYTWDFTDVTGIESNVTNYFDKEEKLGEEDEAPEDSGISETDWNAAANSYQRTARDLSLWEVKGTKGNYFLRLNSQESQTPQNLMERDNIFESAKEIGGNQVWANKTIVPEMKGLWFYTENYDPETHKSYDNLQSNGEWIIKQGDADNPGGLEFKKGNCDWFNKIVVPNVPNNAAVYLRMRKLKTSEAIRYMFGQQESMSELPKNTTSTSGTTRTTETLYSIGNGDYIVAIMNTTGSKSNLTLSLDGFRVQKLWVSTDPKQIGKTGYTTESRKHQIDHALTAELTGKPIKAYTATYAGTAAAPDYKTMVLTEISNKTRHNMEAATSNGGFTGCILYNDVTDDDKSVSILDGGFHLFVPDMHDGYGDNTQDVLLVSNDNKPLNVLKSFLPQDDYFTYYTTVSQVTSLGQDHFLLPDEGLNKTLILSARKYKFGTDPTDPANVTELTEVSFVRVDPNGFGGKGAFLNKCSAYIVMPADQMKDLNSTNGAKVNVVFESDLFDMNDGIATGVTTIPAENASDTDTYYTLSGMKINRPTQSGLYIKNGKKVYVK